METNPEFPDEEKSPPAKPSALEVILIIIFLLFVASSTYEFGIWIIKDGGKTPQETERPF